MNSKSNPCLAGKKNVFEKESEMIKENPASVVFTNNVVCFCNFGWILHLGPYVL